MSIAGSCPAGNPWPLPVALHWSPKSPFVRKVMIVIIECGLSAEIEQIRTLVDRRNPNLAYMQENALGTIPALRLSDGTLLVDSPLICDYLLTLRPRPDLLPPAGRDRFDVLLRQAFADAMLNAILLWRQERIRPAAEQSAAMHAAHAVKAATALDKLDRDARVFRDKHDLGNIATGSALAYLDLRFPDMDWRRGRNDLAAWHRRFEDHPAARATRLALD